MVKPQNLAEFLAAYDDTGSLADPAARRRVGMGDPLAPTPYWAYRYRRPPIANPPRSLGDVFQPERPAPLQAPSLPTGGELTNPNARAFRSVQTLSQPGPDVPFAPPLEPRRGLEPPSADMQPPPDDLDAAWNAALQRARTGIELERGQTSTAGRMVGLTRPRIAKQLMSTREMAQKEQDRQRMTSQVAPMVDPATGWPIDPVTGQPVAPLRYQAQQETEQQRADRERIERDRQTRWDVSRRGARVRIPF